MATETKTLPTTRDLADGLAAFLNGYTGPGTWEVKPDTYRGTEWEVHGPDGMVLYTSLASSVGYDRNDRFRIQGRYPADWNRSSHPDKKHHPEAITVARNRPMPEIVRDFGRRFWGPYSKAFEMGLNAVAASNIHRANMVELAHDLCGLLGQTPGWGPDDLSRVPSPSLWEIGNDGRGKERLFYGHVTVNGPDSVSIDINSCRPDIARKVLQLLMAESAARPVAQEASDESGD